MSRWQLDRVTPIAPVDFLECDNAYLLRLEGGGEFRECIVEFESPSVLASINYAEEALRSYLDDQEPPQQLVVMKTGEVRVVTLPREVDESLPPHAARPRVLRARRHSRG
jgi:hypothetical protein